jgi:hypothetical protein
MSSLFVSKILYSRSTERGVVLGEEVNAVERADPLDGGHGYGNTMSAPSTLVLARSLK